MVDTRGDTPRLLVGASPLARSPGRRSDDLGASWEETPNGAIRFPDGSEETLARVWQLVPGPEDGVVYAGTEPGAVWSPPTRRDLRPRAGPVGPPRAARVGRGLRWPGLPHDPAAPHRPAVGDGRDLHGRGLPDHGRGSVPGRRATRASRRSSCRRVSSTPPSASACTRSPGTRRGPSGSTSRTTAASTAPTTRAESGSPSPTACPPSSAFLIVVHPHEPDTVYVFPLNDGAGRYPPEGKARSGAPATRGRPGGARCVIRLGSARGLLRRRDARRDEHRRLRERGIYVGTRNGAVWASSDSGTPGARSSPTCPT